MQRVIAFLLLKGAQGGTSASGAGKWMFKLAEVSPGRESPRRCLFEADTGPPKAGRERGLRVSAELEPLLLHGKVHSQLLTRWKRGPLQRADL